MHRGSPERRRTAACTNRTTKIVKMLKTLVISVLIIAICMVLLAIRIVLKKNGRFPNGHVSGSKALRDKGITCMQSQDFAMRLPNPHRVEEHEK